VTYPSDLVACFRDALAAITAPRFFSTERGFQGELLVQLSQRIRLPDQAILEQEYQKRQHEHGLTIRPDIVIHEPFDPTRFTDRTQGNLAVVELKLCATAAEAAKDFASLATMIKVLHYPLGVFVNIGAAATYAELVPAEVRGRVVAFAVDFVDGKTHVIEQRT
jgi:hypothetical protein